jgi:glyoxylase-like metal-dependent hydrolase (beta-lactamase superfamily II)
MTPTRRAFLEQATSCAAHIALMGVGVPALARAAWAAPKRTDYMVAQEAFGRLERIADGVWALVSTPLTGDRRTLCNGGIVSGRNGTLVVEAFASDAGAKWMAAQAKSLTGRDPTHVVVTHYHSDHTAGLRGLISSADVVLHSTRATSDLVRSRNQDAPAELLDAARTIPEGRATRIDLGGRSVTIAPVDGHTPSDVTLRVNDPDVVFCGDLVWNGMFPNFVDAIPSHLTRTVRGLRSMRAATYVPGHGAIASPPELDAYIGLLDDVEGAARRAITAGQTAEAAGAAYKLPAALENWTLFNPRYFERAIGAWMKELGAT